MTIAYSTLFLDSAKQVGKNEAQRVISKIEKKKNSRQYTEKDECIFSMLIDDAFYDAMRILEQLPKNILTYEAQCALSFAETLKVYNDSCQKASISPYKFKI